MIFDDIPRTDATPARHSEGRFEFLNRSASRYFGYVRDLLEEWFSHVPRGAQTDLRGALRADDRQADSAFWELYLHEAYLRSGYDIEIHPVLSGRTTHPDFLMTRGEDAFYLEAVGVGLPPSDIAEERRLQDVHQVLADLKVEKFSLELATYAVGPRALSTRKMRTDIRNWLASLDPDEVIQEAKDSPYGGFDRLPGMTWEDDGWRLVFHALPRKAEVRDQPLHALGAMGPGEAVIVDNVTGINRVLDQKHGKYGKLDRPLVVAVLSNTLYPTKDYEVEQALYGVSSYRPQGRLQHPESMFADGFWLTKREWRHRDTPQIITAHGLTPWSIIVTQPRLWTTLERAVDLPAQPDWLATMNIGAEAIPGPARSLAEHFGLASDWPGMTEPDFDVSYS